MCCGVVREKYRLRDRWGKATQIGAIVEGLLEERLSENIAQTVCVKCRRSLLRLQKLWQEYFELKDKIKLQLRERRSTQPPDKAPAVRLRSPSSQLTGISPAGKRVTNSRSACLGSVIPHARKTLFPRPEPKEQERQLHAGVSRCSDRVLCCVSPRNPSPALSRLRVTDLGTRAAVARCSAGAELSHYSI